MKVSLVILLTWVLTGCLSTATKPSQDEPPGFNEWLSFTVDVNRLDPAELAWARNHAAEQYRRLSDDESRLRFAYLLSRSQSAEQDLKQSYTILSEIDSASDYAPLRDLLIQQLMLIAELNTARQQTEQLQAQLDALRAIEADLRENQKNIEKLSK